MSRHISAAAAKESAVSSRPTDVGHGKTVMADQLQQLVKQFRYSNVEVAPPGERVRIVRLADAWDCQSQ